MRFLRETWELFYWSLCCPSKLQQRMNEWAPQEERNGQRPDTQFSDILFFNFNRRFFNQFFLLILILTLPLFCSFISASISSNDLRQKLLILGCIPIAAYGIAYWFLPITFLVPLILFVAYQHNSDFSLQALTEIELASQANFFKVGLVFGAGVLVMIAAIGLQSLRREQVNVARNLFWIGGASSTFIVTGLATNDWQFTLLFSGLVASLLFIVYSRINALNDKSFTLYIIILIVTFIMSSIAASKWSNTTFDFSIVSILILISGLFASLIFAPNNTINSLENSKLKAIFVVAFILSSMASSIFLVYSNTDNISISLAILSLIVSVVISSALAFALALFIAGGFASASTLAIVSFVSFVVTSLISSVVMVAVESIAALPVEVFLAVSGSVAITIASIRNSLSSITLSSLAVLIIGFEYQNGQVLLVIPIMLLGYYRFAPDYFCMLLSSLFSIHLNRSSISASTVLRWLPPYATEFLPLPLPNYDRLLAAAFQENPSFALATFQQIQTLSGNGFAITVKQSLPQIVADQLVHIQTTQDLIKIASTNHPLLPLIIPQFYQTHLERAEDVTGAFEVDVLFPRFQNIARDTKSILLGSIELRYRSLKQIQKDLTQLQNQLSGFRLKKTAIQRWQPVFECWQNLLELELTQQNSQSQGNPSNPFIIGNPIKLDRSDLFKGRQAFADELVRHVLDRNRPTLVLHGPRRCGKTSFLLNLPRLLPSNLIPIYIDMQRAGMTESDGDFCYGLVHAIQHDSGRRGLQFSLPERTEFYSKPFSTLEDWLDIALTQLGEKHLLLSLDEFEKIGIAMRAGRVSDRLFDELRSLIQHNDHLCFLFSGVEVLDELGPNWHSYFISIVPIEMLYLKPEEAEDLLRNPDPDFSYSYDSNIIEELLCLTRCHPNLLQLLGDALVAQADRQRTQLITTNLLQDSIQVAFTKGEPYFMDIWRKFTGTSPTEVNAGQNYLLALASDKPPRSLMDTTTQAARCRLLRYHVIQKTNEGDRIEIPLFEQWVRERAIKSY